jgi:hypothetical protein
MAPHEARNDSGEIDITGFWRYHKPKATWIRDRKSISRGERDRGLVSQGTRVSEEPGRRGQREAAYEEQHGGRRQSRGLRSDNTAAAEILEMKLPHVLKIACTDPIKGPFVWPNGGEATMVLQRDGVVARIASEFGVVQLSSLDPNKPQVNALLKLVEAFKKNVPLMIVDTEFDPATGDAKDLAVVVSDWNGVVIDSMSWQQQPKLHTRQVDEWQEYVNEHKQNLVVCWGVPELELFARAGRRVADGSDGFDVREAILQVFPGMRNLAHAGSNAMRFSLSMDFLTPVFGMRAKAHHTALRDCEAEAVLMTAFVRYIGLYVVRNLSEKA